MLSPDEILKIGCMLFRNFALSRSNGVEKTLLHNQEQILIIFLNSF